MNAERKARSTGKRESPAAVSSVFFVLSFLGWCMETVYCSDFFTKFPDRGFLTLPFCVIYGAPPCLARLLFGTPREGRLARAADKAGLNGAGSILFRYGSYFLLSAGTATLFELSFGALFDAFGVRLWNYSRRPLNFRGYICGGQFVFMDRRGGGLFFSFCLARGVPAALPLFRSVRVIFCAFRPGRVEADAGKEILSQKIKKSLPAGKRKGTEKWKYGNWAAKARRRSAV